MERGSPHRPGCDISRDRRKYFVVMMLWYCHGLAAYQIDIYDDLLLPGHRLLAQLPVFASGEHFKNIFRLYSQSCSTVYFPIRIVKCDRKLLREVHNNTVQTPSTLEGPRNFYFLKCSTEANTGS